MIERIKSALERCGITLWRVNQRVEESAELFFVKKELDTRRTKDVRKYEVTVFRDVEAGEGGRPARGSTSVVLAPSMDDGRIDEELKGAYYAAQFAANPWFDLPDPVQAPAVEKTGELARAPLARSAGKMAKALFASDAHQDAFVNSAEIFVVRSSCRIISSEGTDVSYTDARVEGEFVVQCKEPEDVEMYNTFEYDELDGDALSAKVSEALAFVRDRARAQKVLKSGKYDLVSAAAPWPRCCPTMWTAPPPGWYTPNTPPGRGGRTCRGRPAASGWPSPSGPAAPTARRAFPPWRACPCWRRAGC